MIAFVSRLPLLLVPLLDWDLQSRLERIITPVPAIRNRRIDRNCAKRRSHAEHRHSNIRSAKFLESTLGYNFAVKRICLEPIPTIWNRSRSI